MQQKDAMIGLHFENQIIFMILQDKLSTTSPKVKKHYLFNFVQVKVAG